MCYTDAAVKTELEAARTALGAERVAAYDKLPVCYTLLADRILEELPRNEDGIMVVVHPKLADEPLKHVRLSRFLLSLPNCPFRWALCEACEQSPLNACSTS